MDKSQVLHYKIGDKDIIRFLSGTVVLEEAIKNGCYTGMYWSASNQVQRENISAGMPFLDPAAFPVNNFILEIDGQSLHNRWQFVENTQNCSDDGHIISVTTLIHTLRPVKVNVCTELDDSSIITRWLEITNTDDKPAALSKVSPFCGILWHNNFGSPDFLENVLSRSKNCKTPFSVAYIDAYAPSEEFNLRWVDISCPEYVFANRCRKNFGAPYYIARNNISGETFYIALAWSGGFETKFSYDRLNKILSFETGPYGKAPLRVISPGETVVSPAVHIGLSHNNIDEMTAEWYRHLRNSVIPKRRGNNRIYTIAGRVVEEAGDWIKKEIDIAQEMGIEAFMVDAGWYGEPFTGWWEHRGDWFEGSYLPEGGLKGIKEYCHKKNMLFGLWMEAESLSSNSKTYHEHPEYKSKYEPENLHHDADTWEVNLSVPEAANYITACIKDVILNKELDFYKLDYNISPNEGLATDKDGYAENNTWRHFEVLFGAFDEVRRQNPDIALENCASGGGRNDLGMMSHFNYCAQSDYSQMPLSIRNINAMTMFLPPEAICYYHNHMYQADRLAGLDTHLRVCLFAIPIFVGFGAQNADRSSFYFKKTREYIKLAKGFCRSVMENGAVVYHHTPYIGMSEPASFCVLEYGTEDKSKGYCGIFKLNSGLDTFNLRLKGIDESKNYEITRKNSESKFILSGFEIINSGINITLENINTSELILYIQV